MRFKATFTSNGIHVLERGFLPTFEKFGKSVQVMLGEQEVHLIQTAQNTDGPHVLSRFYTSVLFDELTYKCESKHNNLIAFQVDVGLLLRVFRSATANCQFGEGTIEVKLSQRNVAGAAGGDGQAKPFLTFTARGDNLCLVQEVPISKPYTADAINSLILTKEDQMCSFYVDLFPSERSLTSTVDRLKSVSDTILFGTGKNGDLHLNVRGLNMFLGTQVRQLAVFPTDVVAEFEVDRDIPTDQQLEAAIEADEALAVHVQQKHMAKVMTSIQHTTPSQILCGITDEQDQLHIMFVFKDPLAVAERFDDTIHLSFRLPGKDWN